MYSELRRTAALKTPHRGGLADGLWYLVSEFVAGRDGRVQ
jgi:hypothetical protein